MEKEKEKKLVVTQLLSVLVRRANELYMCNLNHELEFTPPSVKRGFLTFKFALKIDKIDAPPLFQR